MERRGTDWLAGCGWCSVTTTDTHTPLPHFLFDVPLRADIETAKHLQALQATATSSLDLLTAQLSTKADQAAMELVVTQPPRARLGGGRASSAVHC